MDTRASEVTTTGMVEWTDLDRGVEGMQDVEIKVLVSGGLTGYVYISNRVVLIYLSFIGRCKEPVSLYCSAVLGTKKCGDKEHTEENRVTLRFCLDIVGICFFRGEYVFRISWLPSVLL